MDRKYKFSIPIILTVMAVVGACGIIYEYALGFLGNNLIGSSHEALVMVMSFMIASMGAGAYLQNKLFKKDLLDKFLLVEIVLAILGGLSVITIYTSYSLFENYRILLYAYVSVMGAFIGAELPLIYRVNEECKKKYDITLVPNLSNLMAIDYFGALIGGGLFAYLLIPHSSVDNIVLNLAWVNLLVSALAFAYFFDLLKHKFIIAKSLIVGGLIIFFAGAFTNPLMSTLEQRCYASPIVYQADSPYQHLVLTRSIQGDTRLFINGQLQFSSIDEHIYHEHLVHTPMTIAESRDRVLILGGGDGMALREVLKYDDVNEVTLVDLDPIMTKIFSENEDLIELNDGAFLDARVCTLTNGAIEAGETETIQMPTKLRKKLIDNDRYLIKDVKVLNVDADQFIRQIKGKYDVIIIDFPDPSRVELAKLYSVDFYLALQRVMDLKTLVTVQSTSPYHAEKVFMCIGKSMGAAGLKVLPFHQNVPSFNEWGWHLAWNYDIGHQALLDKVANSSLLVETKFLTEDVMLSSFVFGKDRLTSSDIKMNTNMQPVIYEYYKRSWVRN